jgi:hypothetical protein
MAAKVPASQCGGGLVQGAAIPNIRLGCPNGQGILLSMLLIDCHLWREPCHPDYQPFALIGPGGRLKLKRAAAKHNSQPSLVMIFKMLIVSKVGRPFDR